MQSLKSDPLPVIRFANNKFRLQILSLIVGLLLMGIKFGAWWYTNSNAILTDALESIINVLASGFGLYSLLLSAKPRDRNHPYGHGKIEFISAGFEGGLILVAGLLIIGKSVYNFFYPQVLDQLDLGIVLVFIAGLVNYLMGRALILQGSRSNSLVLEAGGQHLQTDAYSSAGLLLGLGVLYLTNLAWIDNLIALLFGGFILYAGLRLFRTAVAGIMDEADYQLIRRIVHSLQERRSPDWIDVHNFRVIKYGPTLHIDCHLTVPWYYDVHRAHQCIKAFEATIDEQTNAPVELFIHTDPCEPPNACTICTKTDCHVRQAALKNRVDWTLENVMENAQHYPEKISPPSHDKSQ